MNHQNITIDRSDAREDGDNALDSHLPFSLEVATLVFMNALGTILGAFAVFFWLVNGAHETAALLGGIATVWGALAYGLFLLRRWA